MINLYKQQKRVSIKGKLVLLAENTYSNTNTDCTKGADKKESVAPGGFKDVVYTSPPFDWTVLWKFSFFLYF